MLVSFASAGLILLVVEVVEEDGEEEVEEDHDADDDEGEEVDDGDVAVRVPELEHRLVPVLARQNREHHYQPREERAERVALLVLREGLLDLVLLGEDLHPEEYVDVDEQEEQHREARDVDQRAHYSLNELVQLVPRLRQLEHAD